MKQISTITGILIIVATTIVLLGGAFAYQQYAISKSQLPISNQISNSNSQNEMAGWKTYSDTNYNFEFQYPASWSVDKSLLSNSTDVQEIVDIRKDKYVVEIYVDKLKDENKALPSLPVILIAKINNQQLVREMQPNVEIVAGSSNYYFRVFSKSSAGGYINDIQNGVYYYSIFYRMPFGLSPTDYNQQVITEADRIIPTFKFTK